MQSLCVSSLNSPPPLTSNRALQHTRFSTSFAINHLRLSIVEGNRLVSTNDNEMMMMKKKKKKYNGGGGGGGLGAVCHAAASLGVRNLQWISAISSAALMVAKGTPIHKSFLIPLFALQAPPDIISWMKGEYGVWAAFLALLVRLFFHIPGELELPFMALLVVIVAPHQVMNLRGTQEGAIISLLLAGYMAFQHFSRTSLQKAFDQGSVIASLAVICLAAVSLLLLI